jgi:hypothetical protein
MVLAATYFHKSKAFFDRFTARYRDSEAWRVLTSGEVYKFTASQTLFFLAKK